MPDPYTDSNPSAFPNGFGGCGMSLRDYFAASFASAIHASSHGTAMDVAFEAYQLADAMLTVRLDAKKSEEVKK